MTPTERLKPPPDRLLTIEERIEALGRFEIDLDNEVATAQIREITLFGVKALFPILHYLARGNASTKYYCIRCFIELKNSKQLDELEVFAAPFLSLALLEDNGSVRDMAMSALAMLGEQALPAVLRALFYPSENARACAAMLLREVYAKDPKRNETIVRTLARMLELERDNTSKFEMITAMAKLEGKPAAQLEAELPDRLRALKQLDERVRHLLKEIDVGEAGDAKNAVRALAGMGLDALVPIVWYGLVSPSERVRMGAITALAVMGDELVLPFIASKLSDKNEAVRRLACRALESFGKQALPWFLLKAEDSGAQTDVRAQALCSLGKLGGSDVLEALEGFLEREEPEEVKKAASDAVRAITDVRFAELAKEFFDDGEG
ncbi:MAG: HEAT repeat domain-containing protein [Candidatus Micrarchaeia archaeon]